MKLEKYTAIIEEQTKDFKSYFEKKTSEGLYKNFVKTSYTRQSDFPIFNIASDNFYIYQRYLKVLKQDIRNYLINPLLEQLLKVKGYKVESFLETIKLKNGFSNSDLEAYNLIPFQFIFTVNQERIGIRYSLLYDTDDVVKELVNFYQLDKVIIVHFSTDKDFKFDPYSRAINLSHMTIKMFLEEYVNDSIFQDFYSITSEAIDELQKLIGYDTIPNLNLSNLSEIRINLRNHLKNKDMSDFSYVTKSNIEWLEQGDLEIIGSNLKKGREEVIYGQSDFAKSYVTSEYLFRVLSSNGHFDYTSIVSGYLKTVEQFLYDLLVYQMQNDKNDKWIKRGKKYIVRQGKRKEPLEGQVRKNPNNKGNYQIMVKEDNIKFFDISLGSLIWYLHDNSDCWAISPKGMTIVKDLLLDYKDSVRNGYFHKHNLEDLEEVKRIRENTLTLMCILLGCLKTFEITEFGALDFSFNDFYKKISKIPKNTALYIQDTKISQPQLMKLLYKQERETYNDDGILVQDLYFSKIKEIDTFFYESIEDVPAGDLVVYNKDNVPYRVEYIYQSKDKKSFEKVECYRKN